MTHTPNTEDSKLHEVDPELRKQIVKCFNAEKMEDYEDSYIIEDEQDIEYFDTSAVIDRVEKLITSKVNQEVIKELERMVKKSIRTDIDYEVAGRTVRTQCVFRKEIEDRIRTLKKLTPKEQ